MAGAAVTAEHPFACGNCRKLMQRLTLPGHYGSRVEIDLCPHCDLVWFDFTETAQITGPSLLELIGVMATSQTLPHEMLHAKTACPRCGGNVKIVYNQSRWGRSTQLQCLRRHGAYQSFAQFLGEKGLLRPMSRVDRARLVRDRGHIDCVNCGARIDAADETCSFCRSVPSLLDVARLARALDPHEMLEPHAAHATPALQQAMQCAACGVALPPGETVSCSACGATLAITRLADAHASVAALAPALRAATDRPPPKVVQRRLEALAGDIPRRREWVAGMEADARERRGHGEDSFDWSSLWSRRTNPVRAVLLALAAWWVWNRLR
ncbi:MAG TPA: hypothetical protein VHM00_05195 [Caldimonas sp.]|nr:hypothetical protein [Caldimonas sp.]HEX2540460.1 hypothetical protein [Caldimonas sp.]